MMVSLHGATSNHLLNRRRVFGLGNRPGETDYEAIRNEVDYPDVGFVVVSPYGRGEVAGYDGIAEGDVLRAMADVQRAYRVDADRVHLTGLCHDTLSYGRVDVVEDAGSSPATGLLSTVLFSLARRVRNRAFPRSSIVASRSS